MSSDMLLPALWDLWPLTFLLCFPSGCLSGRGQAESEGGAGRLDKALVNQMEEIYSSLPVRLPEFNPTLHTLYQDWLEGQDSSQARKLLHTEYRDKSHGHAQPPHMQWWEERERLPLKTWMDSYSIVLLPGPSHILKNCGWRRMTDQWLTSQKIILPFNHGGGLPLLCRAWWYVRGRKTNT